MQLLNSFFKFFLRKPTDGPTSLLQSSGKILAVQVTGTLLLFLNNLLIVRYAGDQIYGTYVTIFIWVNIFSVISLFGMDDRFIATIPRYVGTSKEINIYFILRWAIKVIAVVFFFVCLLNFILIKSEVFDDLSQNHSIALYVLILTMTLFVLLIQFLRATNRLLLGQILDKVVRSILTISVLLFLCIFSYKINPQHLLWIQVFALSICIMYIFWKLHKTIPNTNNKNYPEFDKSILPNIYFSVISLLNLLVVRLDVIFLSEYVASSEVGYYNIAMRFADIIHYPVGILNLIVPSLLANAFSKASPEAPYTIIQNAIKIGFMGTFVVFITMLLFGDNLLFLFGKNFTASYSIIILLGISHLITAAVGPLNAIFMVSGKENISLYCLIIQVFVTIMACYFLIPIYHAYGGAYAVLLGNGVYLLLMLLLLYHFEKIIITPFKIIGKLGYLGFDNFSKNSGDRNKSPNTQNSKK